MTLTIEHALNHLKDKKDCKKAYEELQKLKTHYELRQERKKEEKLLATLKLIAKCPYQHRHADVLMSIAQEALDEHDRL